MGHELSKQFFAFAAIDRRENVVGLKHLMLSLEHKFARDGKRTINLDPAYMELPKLVVTSRKNFAHRIYIGEGVFGDVQLVFQHGQFVANNWTYPDYMLPVVHEFMHAVRATYAGQLGSAK